MSYLWGEGAVLKDSQLQAEKRQPDKHAEEFYAHFLFFFIFFFK